MTEKEKLQKLFDAALKSPTDSSAGPPKRAYPNAATGPAYAARDSAGPLPAAAAASPSPLQAGNGSPGASADTPATNAVLDDAASTELAKLLDEQVRRKARKRRTEALVTAIVFFGLSGGGIAWFVQSPSRVEALASAMREIRSVGDFKSIIAKYQVALDRIAVRGRQIDHASRAMGSLPSDEDEKDPNFHTEMKEMMGGDGKTVGDRGTQVQKAFDHMRTQNEQVAKTATPPGVEESALE